MHWHRMVMGSVAALGLCTALCGCGSTNTVQTKPESSPGQQLMELDQAKEKGLVTEREYERMRKKIVREND